MEELERTNKVEELGDYIEWTFKYVVEDVDGSVHTLPEKTHEVREHHYEFVEGAMEDAGLESTISRPIVGLFNTIVSDFDNFVYTVGYSSKN